MTTREMPKLCQRLLRDGLVAESDIRTTADGFYLIYQSLSDLLAKRDILDFLDAAGERLACDRFFDDWFLFAVPHEHKHVYSLVKLREQEHDAEEGGPADGDTPGVTFSFVPFIDGVLLDCLADPDDKNRRRLADEINRVTAWRGQRHHKALKRYFTNPHSQAPYLVATVYAHHMATNAVDGHLPVPERYKELVQQSISYKSATKLARLPRFIDGLNRETGRTVCDNEVIYIADSAALTDHEIAAILTTHTGNTSVYSFAAEVEYHARFLFGLARIPIPFFGRSIYDSAVRADLSVGDTGPEGLYPFYQADSRMVRRQYALHHKERY